MSKDGQASGAALVSIKPVALYSKTLKHSLLPASATLLHPTTGEVMRITMGFRRMTDGEMTKVRLVETERKAKEQDLTDQDILDYLAPLFGTKDGRMEVEGFEDFLETTSGTPEDRFRQYFAGVGVDEDMDVECRILRVLYAGYMQAFFRLIPIELVDLAKSAALQSSLESAVPEAAGNGSGTGV